jgi:regulator of protease activity HflC (stomatin/prohibitin superfamily)
MEPFHSGKGGAMFGFRFIKVQPTQYILHYSGGKVAHEGIGLSFFYFAPTDSLILIPMEGKNAPFIFNEVTADFQEVAVQGFTTYRIADPKRLAQLANFTIDGSARRYLSEDPAKFPERIVNQVQVWIRSAVKAMPLKEALQVREALALRIRENLQSSDLIQSMGVEILDLAILAIKPTPETARALEADIREQLLQRADEAVYVRRNAAVEQERSIKENELNTEIAVENKKRLVLEAQMDAERAVQEKRREMRELEVATQITLEENRRELVELTAGNTRKEADARAYGLAAVLKPLAGLDPAIVQSLASVGMEPGQLVAQAFRQLAESAEKIGQLNISPDLLRELMRQREDGSENGQGHGE